MSSLSLLIFTLLSSLATPASGSICDTGTSLEFGDGAKACSGAKETKQACEQTVSKLENWKSEYQALIQKACNSQLAYKPPTGIVQKSALDQNKLILSQAKSALEQLLQKNRNLLNQEIPSQAQSNIAKMQEQITRRNIPSTQTPKLMQLVGKSKGLFRQNNGEAFRQSEISASETESLESDFGAQAKSLTLASTFARKLLLDASKREKSLAEIDSMTAKTDQSIENLGKNDTEGKKDPSGGNDMKDMAALAGPLAGLAQSAQQNKGQSKDSGISQNEANSPNTADAARTTKGANLSAKNTSTGIKLGGEKSDGRSVPSTESANNLVNSEGSEISQSPFSYRAGSELGDAGSTPSPESSTAASRGGFVDAIGPGGSFGASTSTSKPPRSLASNKTSEDDDALTGFSGGGSLGGASHSGSSESSSPDDSVGEALAGMEEALEDGSNNEVPEELEAAGVEASDSDTLFHRVKECYTRSARKGRIFQDLQGQIRAPKFSL